MPCPPAPKAPSIPCAAYALVRRILPLTHRERGRGEGSCAAVVLACRECVFEAPLWLAYALVRQLFRHIVVDESVHHAHNSPLPPGEGPG